MLKQTVTQSLSLCYYSEFTDVNVTGGGVWSPGEQVTVEGKLLYDWFGQWASVNDTTLKMTFAGNTYKTLTYPSIAGSPNFQFNITVPQLADGQYEVDLLYDGYTPPWVIGCISPCSYSFTVTIQSSPPQGTSGGQLSPPQEQYPSQLSLTVSPEVTVGQSATLIVTATFADGTPAPGFKVDFAINNTLIGSAVTNAKGVADTSFTPEAEGSYTATAWLDADQSVSASASFTASSSTTSGTTCTSTSQCPQGTVCQNGVCTQCNGVIVGSTCVPTWAIVAGVGAVALTGLVIAISK